MEMTLEKLERHWMPFTPNRDFKRHPRMFVRASGMHYFDPSGRRVLDVFCYTGGFGLHAARAGARSVLGIDVSEPALELARSNTLLNGLENVEHVRADLRQRETGKGGA